MTTTTTPNYLDSLLGGGGALRVEGNGITGQQVAAVVHLGEGTMGDYDVASQTVEVSATPVSDLELGLYYYGVGAAGLNSVDTFASGGPRRELGYDAIVNATAQKFYTVYPASWGHAFVTLDGFPVDMLPGRAVTIEGAAYALLESVDSATGTNLYFYVSAYVGGTGQTSIGGVNHVLFVDGTNGSAGGNGTLGSMFLMPSQAIAAAVSRGMSTVIIAIASGTYIETISKPESIQRLVLTEFVPGVRENALQGTVRLDGNIVCISYNGQNNLELNRIRLNGNISSVNPIAAPAQLNLHVTDCTLLSDITALQVVLYGRRTNFTSSASSITASAGYVALDIDRETRKWIRDNGIAISPAPTITIYDGPLTVAEGGDPGGVSDGTVASDSTRQIHNFSDGRRIWQYTRMYSVKLEEGVESTITITEAEHGGDGTPVRVPDGMGGYTDISYPIALVRVELFGVLPSADPGPTVGVPGFMRHTWEGAIDKNAATGFWTNREGLSLVSPTWTMRATEDDVGAIGFVGLQIVSNSNIAISLRFDGLKSPPYEVLVKVTISGTGKFVV